MASYSKTSWIGNELITAADLNRIENGIDDAITAVNNLNDNKVSTSATIAIDHGGTGAINASTARQNLNASAYLSFTDDDTTWSAIYTKITTNIPTGGSATFWSSPSATQIITKNSDLNFGMRGVISRRYADNFDFLAAASASPSFLISIHITDAGQSSHTIGDQGIMIFRGGTPTNYDAQPKMLINLESGSESNVLVSSPRPGVTGVLPIAHGGTGLSSAPSVLVDLESTQAASPLTATPRPGVTGALPVANGGSGANTAVQALKNLGGMAYINLSSEANPTLTQICGEIEGKISNGSAGSFWANGTYAAVLTNNAVSISLKGTIVHSNSTHMDIFGFVGDNTHTHKIVTINIDKDNNNVWAIQKIAIYSSATSLKISSSSTTDTGRTADVLSQLMTINSGESINVDFSDENITKLLTNNKITVGVLSGHVRHNVSSTDNIFDFTVTTGTGTFIYTWRNTFNSSGVLTVGDVRRVSMGDPI